uniref:Lysophosphatidylcholine acyltransferase 2 n=1 Tax=Rattus norvegicus TaxID=10116 RepID=PCAT2_RAT|nr:RecName: Full=Lysophosphatidylcholine acyltransferase 2; Short=LPC acyltransferase 2; Short=LPCAT-2; Short=LysoPC acyltransferase 2; AltName: Full=1-acylglycerol-3-phosphate O-acyltransferase 11; Short=1-AGP acyltransferase 11; Short=1-AGPAT 11; AltName: Full=1-acylglycerophosphocholine O-acyltransferase; AltName: Full=1-alkenylglycerophosphocholine O-acyltransferase; AltName: Full=1-alkylglycerophosphocholine O-acetyltransferase; AltName: Full=Acetyl-CoA:lyso-platelet-activating factor acetyltr
MNRCAEAAAVAATVPGSGVGDSGLRPPMVPRQASFFPPPVPNPFVQQTRISAARRLQMILLGIILLPVRALLVGLVLLLAWPFAVISTVCCPKKLTHPISDWRRKITQPALKFLGRAMFFSMGFRVTVKGKVASPLEAPIFVVAPHSTFFDGIACVVAGLPSLVSRNENAQTPLVGRLLRALQPVLVSRVDPDSRKNTINEIKKRAMSGGEWPQILVFPEGTCTNRSCLITFKPGAFIPGVPVQPVLLRYPNKLDTVTWTWQGYTFIQLCVLTFCQLFTKVEVEFMPVQAPSEEERNDPVLFASRVRNLMAEALEIPVTDHTYEDCRLMISAGQLTLPMEAGLVEFTKISRKLKLDWDGIRKHLDEYASIASSAKGGRIGASSAKGGRIGPVSDVLRQLFALFDRNNDGSIDFREYVIGLAVLCNPANTEDIIQVAFKLFDVDEDGYITEEEFCTILQASLGVPDLNVSGLFREIAQGDSVSYEEFKSFALKHPEYAKIFTTYLDLQTCHVFSLPEDVQTAPSVASNKVSPESHEEGTSGKKVD